MEINIWASCYSEKTDASISFGVTREIIDGTVNLSDTGWIYEGMGDSFWENYYEFEAGVAEANAMQDANPALTHEQALFDVFGNFVISYEVDGETKELDFDFNPNELMYALLNDLL